jgi:hypothetical protein
MAFFVTSLLATSLTTGALAQDSRSVCPDFDPYAEFALYGNPTWSYVSDGIGPMWVGDVLYAGFNASEFVFFRLTDEGGDGNLVSDSDYDRYYPTAWMQAIDFASLGPEGQFVTMVEQDEAPEVSGNYGFECTQWGGEGRLSALNSPEGVNATRWWFCPTPEDESLYALKFGILDGHVPEGCREEIVFGGQD